MLLAEHAKMKTELIEKENKIQALEKRIKELMRDLKDDDVTTEEIVDMLNGVSEPTAAAVGNKFIQAQGYRLIDMRLMATALSTAQKCKHGNQSFTNSFVFKETRETILSKTIDYFSDGNSFIT